MGSVFSNLSPAANYNKFRRITFMPGPREIFQKNFALKHNT